MVENLWTRNNKNLLLILKKGRGSFTEPVLHIFLHGLREKVYADPRTTGTYNSTLPAENGYGSLAEVTGVHLASFITRGQSCLLIYE